MFTLFIPYVLFLFIDLLLKKFASAL